MRRRDTLLTALAVSALTACTTAETPPPPQPGTFTIAVTEPATLLPGQAVDHPGKLLTGALWTPLLAADNPGAAPVPAAAERVESPDQRRWTIRLRPGWRFHDKTPVTAKSYAQTWAAARQEKWAAGALLDELGVREVGAPDELTLEVTLAKPLRHFPVALTSTLLAPLTEAALTRKDWTTLVGNGPFRAERPWSNGTRLVANPDYAGATKAKSEAITVLVADAAAQYAQLTAGKIDLATEIPAAEHGQLTGQFASRSATWPQPEATYLAFPARPEFADQARRHALSMGIDREALATGPLAHRVTPATALLPQALGADRKDSACRPCNHDVQAAALLARQSELPKNLTIYFNQDTDQRTWAEPLAAQLRLSLNAPEIKAKGLPAAEYTESARHHRFDGPYLLTARAAYPHPTALLTTLAAEVGFTNATYTELITTAATSDAADRDLRLAENIALRELPLAPLWSPHGHLYWSTRLAEVTPDPVTGLRLSAIRAG
ncbi:ABC transporter substrate-binding protein [Crossiella sp. SN42]|uniref:peptide ABC transporter substrate-binding protein n=1 Tax=Crossiella sp. SN42 TaxID=2944808 RepID=UPI00207D15AF|nr:ABC transporter substrate-binding protein [Crossiella sp. SN42]MCO1582521.1 ABC transporter substrate-binding protein [Crossiella sp. SN42]